MCECLWIFWSYFPTSYYSWHNTSIKTHTHTKNNQYASTITAMTPLAILSSSPWPDNPWIGPSTRTHPCGARVPAHAVVTFKKGRLISRRVRTLKNSLAVAVSCPAPCSNEPDVNHFFIIPQCHTHDIRILQSRTVLHGGQRGNNHLHLCQRLYFSWYLRVY